MKKVECIIMDWAGTSVDYGCMAPVAALSKVSKILVWRSPRKKRGHLWG